MNEQAPKLEAINAEMTTEQIVALSKKATILMTKPENTDTKAPILLFLKNKGLNAKTYRFTLDEERLASLYPDMKNWTEAIQMMTREHLLDKEVEVFLVTADNENQDIDVRNEVLNLRGLDRIADKNPEGTLRKEFPGNTVHFFGTKAGPTGKAIYSKNGFHCSTTPEEVLSNLKTFGLLDEAKKLVGMG
jgi:hypothetical protein